MEKMDRPEPPSMAASATITSAAGENGAGGPARQPRPILALTALLSAAAAVTFGYWFVRALGPEDVEPFESPLMMAMARQWIVGPGELYGPFGGANPLVLIHAPLYYRIGGLLAWPLDALGTPPLDAARWAGRGLSLVSWACLLGCAYRLGRLGGLPRRSGVWSALLLASSPVLGGLSVAVRPDMLGVLFQTFGALLVLSALEIAPGVPLPARRKRAALVLGGFVAFGLAVCVKQHLVMAAAVSVLLLGAGWLAGRLKPGTIGKGLIVGAGIALGTYAVEGLVTSGAIWDAAFVAASEVRRVHPGGWPYLRMIAVGLLSRGAGIIALLAAAMTVVIANALHDTALGGRSAARALAWSARVALIGLVGPMAVLLGLDLVLHRHALDVLRTMAAAMALVLVLVVIVALALVRRFGRPAAGAASRAASGPSLWIDGPLGAYLAAELALALAMSHASAGAWFNYAVPALVFAAALVGRVLAQSWPASARASTWPLALAALVVLLSAVDQALDAAALRHLEQSAIAAIHEHWRLPRSAFYFDGRPGLNRLNGRPGLVYDDWLYPVFESLHLADSRSGWLAQRLRNSSIRAVVTPFPSDRIEGTGLGPRALGFHGPTKAGPFLVWTR